MTNDNIPGQQRRRRLGRRRQAIKRAVQLTMGLLLTLGLGAVASAQEVTERDGLGAGKLRFHPALLLEGGYDSNIFSEDDDEEPSSAPTIGVRPMFGMSLANPTSVALRVDADLRYKQYLSDQDVVTEQSGLSFAGSAWLQFNPNGPVAFSVHNRFIRTNEQPHQETFLEYDRIYNVAGGTLLVQPGGRILTFSLGGEVEIYRYDQLTEIDRNNFKLDFEGKWKFLPKTAFVVRASQQFLRYETYDRTLLAVDPDEVPVFQDPFINVDFENVDSNPLRLTTGVAGLILNRLSVIALVGYGNGFYEEEPSFSGVIGRGELAYEISSTSRLRAGYQRDFRDSTFGNFMAFHRVYTHYNHLFAGRFLLELDADWEYRDYANVVVPILDSVEVDNVPGAPGFSDAERTENVFGIEAKGTVRLGDFWRVGASYMADIVSSDYVFITGTVAPESSNDPNDITDDGTTVASYQRHQFLVFTGVEW